MGISFTFFKLLIADRHDADERLVRIDPELIFRRDFAGTAAGRRGPNQFTWRDRPDRGEVEILAKCFEQIEM